MIKVLGLQNTIMAEVIKRVTVIESQVELCKTQEGSYIVCIGQNNVHRVIPNGDVPSRSIDEKMKTFESVVSAHKELKEMQELKEKQFEWFYVPDAIRTEIRKILETKGYRILILRRTSNHPADKHMFSMIASGMDKRPNNYIVATYNVSTHRFADIKSGLTYPEAERTMAMQIKDVSQCLN